jgi:hypothetical protein
MAHAKINLQRMLDWIVASVDAGGAQMTDAEICERFGFSSTEHARTLLAELSDQGKIRIDWRAQPRMIVLGAKGGSTFSPARPLAGTVVRRDDGGKPINVHPETVVAHPARIHVARPDQPSRIDQIRAAAESLASRNVRTPAASPAPAVRAPDPAPAETAANDPEKRHASPGKGMGRGWKPANVATRQDRRQLNIHFPSAKYETVERLAAEAGSTPSAWARGIVMSVLDGEPHFERGNKPRISAAVIRAAAAAGEPLDAFITSLIDRGLAAHNGEAA